MENIGKKPVVYWDKKVPDTNLERFQKIIERNHNVKFESYWEFHKWTVHNYTKYLEELWKFFGIISSEPYKEVWVKTGPGFLDNEWFSGARLNYAENLLRIRDGTPALICLDELNSKEIITYSDLYEEVKRYAASFRKNGLKKGDSVACFMSNRKEAIFAMLAAASIGATWGGAVPYYGARAASNIVSKMDPKFLISIDSHQDNGIIFRTLDHLPEIVNNAPTIKKVILIVTEKETRKKDLSNIRNCVFLEDFLQEGCNPDGKVPELIFEQLPFDYPLCVNFTSGTTGLPKAAVHSIGTMLALMQNHSFSYSMNKGDVVCMNFPVGWTVWDSFIPSLGLGLTLFLYCGSNYYTISGKNFWDLISEYHVKSVTLITSQADKMEKLDIIPSKDTDMSCLSIVKIGGSPVKNNNFDYIKNKVNKNTCIGIVYGATEVFGGISGIDMNSPIYGGEIQGPALGIDLQCFDSKSNSVIGQIGQAVICNPVYNLPTHLWKDVNKTKLTDIYLKKFPGVWALHDEYWINPKTKGIVIIGRSDDTLKQKGERFGAADIYFAIHSLDEVQDYLCVPQQKYNGDSRAVLFVKMRSGLKLTPEIRTKIEKKVDEELWEDCVPELILEIPEIPYNLNNKRMESLIRKIIATNEIPEMMNIQNRECLKYYVNIPEILSYNKHNFSDRMENIGKQPVVYWDKKVSDTNLEKFQKIIERNHDVKFESYWEFHKWTVHNYTKYLEELWQFFGIISSEPYKEVWVKTGPGFLDNEWFSGARLNYAENLLRIRDGTPALICLDELNNKEIITYSDLYEEVKRYAASFRKNGLKKGDSLACFMSNRKEAIFAMLAAASIGATWGGPAPYYGARAASNIVSMMDPKFLISIDSHQDNGIIFRTLDHLPEIVNNAPTIEKVILIVTEKETRKKDLSNIRNCVFLEDFLHEGFNPDGKIPELIFEQLPFDYPLCVNFTSGTTGLPKAAVHSIGTMLALMQYHSIAWNMKKGDVVCMNFPVGWTVWDFFIPCLSLGLTLFLYCGSNYYTIGGKNFWDLIGEFHVKSLTLVTSQADKMEKLDIVPSKDTDMSCLSVVTIGSCAVKNHNFDYIKNKVNKNTCIGIVYGATELFGCMSGLDMNSPIYGGEVQVPSLGIDLQCFDAKSNSVIGEFGDAVICNPVYNLPTHLWKDVNRKRLTDIYLKKFPGAWALHDECWINPKTKGMVIIGRSDDTLKQKGERFGAADIYFAIHSIDELQDYLCVPQQKYNGDSRAVLFVKMKPGFNLTPEIRTKIEKKVDEQLWEDCVPELTLEIPEIPYNLNNKRMESLIRKIISTNEIPEVMNIQNRECLKYYVNIPETLSYNKQ